MSSLENASVTTIIHQYTVNVYHHFPDGPLRVELSSAVVKARPATHAIPTIEKGVTPVPASITVDDQNKKIKLQFVDDKGNTDAVAPTGATGSVAVDLPLVLPLTPDPTTPFEWDIAGQIEGVATVTITLTGAGGAPLMEADGVTPFPAIPPLAVTVGPGGAVSATEAVV
jgi:hypothetical protein